MIAEAQLAGHAYAVSFGLDTVELNARVGIVTLYALQAIKEIKVPPGATELPVGDDVQAAGALLLYHVADRAVFNRTQLARIDFTRGKLNACLLNGIRTQETADDIGAERGVVTLHGDLLAVG